MQRCGRMANGFKLTCDLPHGHVGGPGDWHESRAESNQAAADYEWHTTELLRWAPGQFELPPPARSSSSVHEQ